MGAGARAPQFPGTSSVLPPPPGSSRGQTTSGRFLSRCFRVPGVGNKSPGRVKHERGAWTSSGLTQVCTHMCWRHPHSTLAGCTPRGRQQACHPQPPERECSAFTAQEDGPDPRGVCQHRGASRRIAPGGPPPVSFRGGVRCWGCSQSWRLVSCYRRPELLRTTPPTPASSKHPSHVLPTTHHMSTTPGPLCPSGHSAPWGGLSRPWLL